MGSFVHLHLHSEYSLLDGACRISDIPKIAKENGQTSVAITDHGVMYGAVDFYRSCKENGVKPIIGCEVYISPGTRFEKEYLSESYSHLVLLVKNETGYKNLIYMVSKAFEEGFYSKPRIDRDLLIGHHDGLICLSACMSGEIPKFLLKNDYPSAVEKAKDYENIFGKNNFYLELQDHGLEEDEIITDGLLKIHDETGIPLVCTNDVHYLKKSDSQSHKILMCLQMNTTLEDGKAGFANDEFYFKSYDEMERLFGKYEGALENTLKIAEECNFDFEFKNTFLPRYPVENGMTPDEYLRFSAEKGLEEMVRTGKIVFDEKYGEKEYRERMEYELSVIAKMGYSEYYLIVRDFINYAKSHRIPTGPGRGSGAGSLVAYLVGITEVDSLKFDLLFERFLNPERVSMPDFDTDFADEKRDEVYEYVKSKYGKDRVSHIITFGTLAAKAVVRDVGRVLGMSYSYVSEVAEAIPTRIQTKNADGSLSTITKVTLEDALKLEKLKTLYENDEKVKKLIDISKALEGMPRHASTHAAGVVITDKPIYEYVPLGVTKGTSVTQFDMNTIADLGLLKFDFLGLRFLTIIENTVDEIKKKNKEFDIEKIPLDDEETYKMISKGDTVGIFQMESQGMRSKLMQLRPENIGDIMAAIALYRPGPMNSIGRYIENKRNREKIEYPIPLIKDIISPTFGCVVYQEQVMQIFRTVAGYSFGQADIIRKAMSKKQQGKIESERQPFVDAAVDKGVEKQKAEELFEEMVGFSKYAFNKSHAASYAFVTYRTAYLKCHYPGEYFASILTSVVGEEDKISLYKDECSKAGIVLSPPDINESGCRFCFSNGKIVFPLLGLKNVGRTFVENIEKERENGVFKSFDDFLDRLAEGEINKRQLETLIKAGCFDSLGKNRAQLLSVYEKLADDTLSSRKGNADGQLDFFSTVDSGGDSAAENSVTYPDLPDISLKEKLRFEKEVASVYFSGNILDSYSKHIETLSVSQMQSIVESFDRGDEDTFTEGTGEYKAGQKVRVCGSIVSVSEKNTRNGDKMAFVRVEDRHTSLEIVVFPKIFEEFGYLLKEENTVAIQGEIGKISDEPPKILANEIIPLYEDKDFENGKKAVFLSRLQTATIKKETKTSKIAKPKTLYLRLPDKNCEKYNRVVAMSEIFEGHTPLVLYDESTGEYFRLNRQTVSVSEKTLGFFEDLLGKNNVVLK